MSNKTNIEEDIKTLKDFVFIWKDHRLPIITDYNIQAIENILADRERLEKENKELMKVKISASANTIISDLQKELNEENNRCAKFAVENSELQIKANKYDSLVEKIKNEINRLRRICQDRDLTNKEAFYLDCYKELLEELKEDK